MKHTIRRQLLGLSLAFSTLLAMAYGNTAAAAAPVGRLSVRSGLVAIEMPGLQSGNRLSLDGVSLLVPPPGAGAWGAALQMTGSHRLGIETALDGSVTVYREPARQGQEAAAEGALQGSRPLSACSDGAYALEGMSWTSKYNWYFKTSSSPVDSGDATQDLRDAVVNITHADNNCGLSDNVSATAGYQGSTSKSANIGTGSKCQGSDGTSVVDFGNLLSVDLGYVCWWTQGGKPVEADLRLNSTDDTWFVVLGDLCRVKFSIEDVATHEFGHVFGLGDLSESLHPDLTMSTVMLPCQFAETTLGLGDIKGLEALY
jgi:hypothetical protein